MAKAFALVLGVAEKSKPVSEVMLSKRHVDGFELAFGMNEGKLEIGLD